MKMKALDFTPSKLFRGDGVSILVGTQGEIIKMDKEYKFTGPIAKPFPSTISEGIIVDGIWAGFGTHFASQNQWKIILKFK